MKENGNFMKVIIRYETHNDTEWHRVRWGDRNESNYNPKAFLLILTEWQKDYKETNHYQYSFLKRRIRA